jgi:hypothetical protein
MTFTLVKQFAVTIPAGTTIANPLVTPIQFEPNEVESIDWLFPAGCQGLVGIQIGARSVPVIPADRTQWFIRSGDSQGFSVSGMHKTGDWSVIGYNLGNFPHTIHLTFRVHRITKAAPPKILVLGGNHIVGMGES